MIDYSPPVAYAYIKKVLGEKVDGPTTKEERQALHEVFKRDLDHLLETWAPIEKITARDAEFETNSKCLAGAVPRGETVILIAFEINGPDFSGLVNVVLSYTTIQSALEKVDAWTPAA